MKELFLRYCAVLFCLFAASGCSLETEPEKKPKLEAIGQTVQGAKIGEACSGNGNCTSEVPGSECGPGGVCVCPVCTSLVNGSCTALPAGTACGSGGNACTDTCDGAGACTTTDAADGAPCGAGDECGATCSAGTCSGSAAPNGTSCDDGDPCTSSDQCSGGACSGSALCADNFCETRTCDAGLGQCVDASRNTGDGCSPNGGNPTAGCSGICQADGSCSTSTSKTSECNSQDTFCEEFTCNGSTGECDTSVPNLGLGCQTPANPVAGCAGICQADGSCSTSTSKTSQCNTQDTACLNYTCNASTGDCDDADQNDGVGCDTSDDSFGCDGKCSLGACVTAGGSKTAECDASDNLCSNSSCNSGTGQCQAVAQNNNTGCEPNGGNPVAGCSGMCQSGSCSTATSKTASCDGTDTACLDVSCDAGTGACTAGTPRNNGTGCNTATGALGCSGICSAGTCSGATSKTAECDAADSFCNAGSCDAGTGACVNSAINTGTGCNPGSPATVGCSGICAAGSCSTAVTKNAECIDQLTGNQCTVNLCNSGTGACVETALTGQSCDDGAACTSNSTCNSSGQCRGGDADDAACNAGAPACRIPVCLVATSSNAAGCDYPNVANGTPCGPAISCNTSTATVTGQPLCASGSCPSPVVTNCAPFNCSSSPSPACRDNCSNDTHCAATAFCNTSTGACQSKLANGANCTGNNQCTTGICNLPDGGGGPTEGVCCDTACTGQCESCSSGTCTAVTSGQPVGQRTACTAHATCGGSCQSGSRTSCTYPTGECVAEECTVDAGTGENFYQPQLFCSNGSCPGESAGASSCAGSVCGLPGGCLGGCVNDSECADGFYCPAPGATCQAEKTQGSVCTRSGECANGLGCVDGVCCNSGCTGACEACNITGSEGTCSPAPDGSQPVGARPDCAGTSGCQGSCDGQNRFACAYPGSDTSCGTPVCSGNQVLPAGVCNGAGACGTPAPVDCAPGSCVSGACDTDCSACTPDQFCVSGACVDKLVDGSACSLDNDCESGFCVDGVCCDTACSGQCEACDVSGAVGTCSAVPATEMPRGARTPCATDGSACGGSCDGTARNTCTYPGESTECRASSCQISGGKSLATLAGYCEGNGSCSEVQTQICPGVCSGTICGGGCTVDGDCVGTEYCSAGVCVAKLVDGDTCSTDSQCENAHCVDGICCDTACDSACEECGSGTCQNRTGSPLPGRAPCGGSDLCAGTCSGASATCSYPGAAVSCGAEVCTQGYSVPASSCDGAGRCAPSSGSSCGGGLLCNGSVCHTSCTDDDQCAAGLICDAGSCVTPPTPGTGGSGMGGANMGTGGSDPGPMAGADGNGSGGRTNGMGGDGETPDIIDALDEGTCGCSIPGGDRPSSGLLLLGGLLWGLRQRRRRAA